MKKMTISSSKFGDLNFKFTNGSLVPSLDFKNSNYMNLNIKTMVLSINFADSVDLRKFMGTNKIAITL